MAQIQVLSQSVADKIAAGEVAERPAAVVKELVENAIDAGADDICVEIRRGGIEYIGVTDNGKGIAADELEKAFLRHATSKLRSVDDLFRISTMGFRGEALASICAVSSVEVVSRTEDAEEGAYMELEHGAPSKKEEVACNRGTSMVVKNLFANVPARMKFLKRDATEAGYVADVLTRMALARPDVSITYTCDGKEVFSTSGDGKLRNTVLKIYGLDYAKASLDVDYSEDNVRISGVIGKPEIARGNRARQTFLVNNRYIKSHVASKIVSEAYRNSIMIGKFPFFVLNICISPEFIDVNVHPAKTEIKFSNENRVYDIIYHAVSNALRGGLAAVSSDASAVKEKSEVKPVIGKDNTQNHDSGSGYFHKPQSAEEKPSPKVIREYLDNVVTPKAVSDAAAQNGAVYYSEYNFLDEEKNRHSSGDSRNAADNRMISVCETGYGEAAEQPDTEERESHKEKVHLSELPLPIGQLFETYILCQSGDVFYMIDQHAAHERYRFENLKKSYYAHERMSQMLLNPIILKLDYAETQTVLANLDTFTAFGFEIENFGSGSLIVNATPVVADESEIRDLILEIAEAMSETGRHSVADFEERALDMISCKYAIKANHKLNAAEMQDLIKKVWEMAADGITTCPHGRPIKIEFTKTEIEKMFKRRV